MTWQNNLALLFCQVALPGRRFLSIACIPPPPEPAQSLPASPQLSHHTQCDNLPAPLVIQSLSNSE